MLAKGSDGVGGVLGKSSWPLGGTEGGDGDGHHCHEKFPRAAAVLCPSFGNLLRHSLFRNQLVTHDERISGLPQSQAWHGGKMLLRGTEMSLICASTMTEVPRRLGLSTV